MILTKSGQHMNGMYDDSGVENVSELSLASLNCYNVTWLVKGKFLYSWGSLNCDNVTWLVLW